MQVRVRYVVIITQICDPALFALACLLLCFIALFRCSKNW